MKHNSSLPTVRQESSFDLVAPSPSMARADAVFGFLSSPKRTHLPPGDVWGPLRGVMDLVASCAPGEQYREAVDGLAADHVMQHDKIEDECAHLTTDALGHLYSSLTLASQKYIFGVPMEPRDVLPAVLGIPWSIVARAHGAPMTLTYDALILNNWYLKDPTLPPDLSNIEVALTVAGHEAERGFARVHCAIEAVGGDLPERMLALSDECQRMSAADAARHLKSFLEDAQPRIQKMANLVGCMYSQCSSDDFWNRVRITLMGSPPEAFPFGIRVAGTGIVLDRKGGSGAQSPLLHSLDHFFGIFHLGRDTDNSTMSPTLPESRHEFPSDVDSRESVVLKMLTAPPEHARRFILEQRKYMASAHRAFYDHLASLPTARDLVLRFGDAACVRAYNGCIGELVRFRGVHQRIAHKYISVNAQSDTARQGGGTNIVDAKKGSQLSNFERMLPQLVAETRASILPDALPSST